jgi:RimJ/RimL family protein N-acetyltransferase
MQKNLFIEEYLPLLSDDLIIDLFKAQDISSEYLSWLNDKDLMKFSNQRFEHHTAKSSLNYLKQMKKIDAIFLSICASETKELIGTMSVYFNKNHSTSDIGILVGNKKFRKIGIGTQALKLTIDVLKRNGIRKITSGTLECNLAMIKIIKKLGMEPDGIKRAQEIINGKPYNMQYYAVFS